MTRQTIAAAPLGPLAPLLASLLVVLASFPALEAIRARLTPRVRAFAGSPYCGLASASPPRGGLLCAAGSTGRGPASAETGRPRSSASRSSPSAG